MKTPNVPKTARAFVAHLALALAVPIAYAGDGPHRGVEHGGIVHFLDGTGSSLERFDLDTGASLDDLVLPTPVDDFTIDAERIYYAGGRLVSSMDHEGGDHAPLANTIGRVSSLAVLKDNLYARVDASPGFVNLDKRTGSTVETKDYWYAMREMEASASRPGLFGQTSDDLQMIPVNEDGTLGEAVESPYDEDYRVGTRVWLSGDAQHLIGELGTVFRADDLRFRAALGRTAEHVDSRGEETFVLHEGRIVRYSKDFFESGAAELDDDFRSSVFAIHAADRGVFAFRRDADDTLRAALVPWDDFGRRPASFAPDPTELGFTPDAAFEIADGRILMLDKVNRAIHVWQPGSASFGPGLSLAEHPEYIAYSASENVVFLGYTSGRVTAVDPDSGEEAPFAAVAGRMRGLSLTDEHVFVVDDTGAWNSHWTFDFSGRRLHDRDWTYHSSEYVWSGVGNRMYFLRDDTSPNDLLYETIDVDGTISDETDSPYHSSEGISHPLRVSADGGRVLLGSGRIFDGESLELVGALANEVADARWLADGSILSVGRTLDSDDPWAWPKAYTRRHDLQEWGSDLLGTRTVSFDSDFAMLVPGVSKTYVVREIDGKVAVLEWHVGGDDLDGDGLADLIDDYPADPANTVPAPVVEPEPVDPGAPFHPEDVEYSEYLEYLAHLEYPDHLEHPDRADELLFPATTGEEPPIDLPPSPDVDAGDGRWTVDESGDFVVVEPGAASPEAEELASPTTAAARPTAGASGGGGLGFPILCLLATVIGSRSIGARRR